MAAYLSYIFVFILLARDFNSNASVERRFSNLKRCADQECSMLVCRGKAVRDFYGTDCRFLTFKEGETIYVYYKLAGRRTDLWAGSVGSRFGYFPKDLLAINHIYTKKELEVSAEETDFVCFDTGLDQFDDYDVDSLLRASFLQSSAGGKTDENKTTLEQNKSPESTAAEEEPAETLTEDQTDDTRGTEEDSRPDEVAGDGEEGDGEQGDGEEGDGEEGDGEPGDGEEGDGEEGDGEEGDGEEGDGEPGDGEQGDGEPGDGVTSDLSSSELEAQREPSASTKAVDSAESSVEPTTERTHDDPQETQQRTAAPGSDAGSEHPGSYAGSEHPGSDPGSDAGSEHPGSDAGSEHPGSDAGSEHPGSDPGSDAGSEHPGSDAGSEHPGSDAGSEHGETKDAPSQEDVRVTHGFSDGRPIPQLKTTLGTTFDAVTSDDEDTLKVTLYEEEEERGEKVHDPSDDHSELPSKSPLLSSTKESSVLEHKDIPESKEEDDSPETEQSVEAVPEDGSAGTSPGDRVFAMVSGGERTAHVPRSEEEEEDEEDVVSETPDRSEEVRESSQPLATDPEPEPEEDIEPLGADPPQEPEQNNNSHELISDDEVELEVGDEPVDPFPADEEKSSEPTEHASTQPLTQKDDNPADPQSDLEPQPLKANMLSDDDDEDDDEDDDLGEVEEPNEEGRHVEQKKDTDGFREHDVVQNATEESYEDLTLEDEDMREGLPTVREGLPTVREGLPTVREGLPTVREGLPTVREGLPTVGSERKETKSREQLITDLEEEPTRDSEQKQRDPKQDANSFRQPREYLNTYLVKNTTELRPEEELTDPEEGEEELLEDENAASSKIDGSQGRGEKVKDKETESSDTEPGMAGEDVDHNNEDIDTEAEMPEPDQEPEDAGPDQSAPEAEPEYSDSVLRLTLLRSHFNEEVMKRFQSFLGLNNLFKVEAMFSDLEQELKAVRQSPTDNGEDIEKALEIILEASETPILDEIENMLDKRDLKNVPPKQDASVFDEEAAILDDFQELAFSLRQKYSAASDSTPLATESQVDIHADGDISEVMEEKNTLPKAPEDPNPNPVNEDPNPNPANEDPNPVNDNSTVMERPAQIKTPKAPEDPNPNPVNDNSTVMEKPAHIKTPKEEFVHDEEHKSADMDIEEDGGHFNRNKDNQPSFDDAEEVQKVPQPVLDSVDMGLGVQTEPPSPGSFDSSSVSHFSEEGPVTSAPSYVCSLLYLLFQYCGSYVFLMISVLPEEWKPGPTFLGLPWAPVVTSVLLGLITTVVFLWRSILTVRKKVYLAGEKEMKEQLHKVIQEKSDVLSKAAELERQGAELREQQRASAVSASSALERVRQLEKLLRELDKRNEQLSEEKNSMMRVFDEERAQYLRYVHKSADFEKTISKLSRSLKKTQDTLAKSKVLMDESKIREDARNVQQQCLERDYATLKDQNSSLKSAAKDWEDRNRDLCEQIRVFQKSQDEFEDAIAQKDHSNEVLSELLVDLEAYDLQKGDARVVANGDDGSDKTTAVRNRIKQLMDVSRVQTTLTVVEEERNKFQARLEREEKARKALEEKYQELEHNTTALKSEKGLIENQLKILQQKNEIMTEMYQQKEIALQKRLTNEELERRDKELRLCEVDGKALETEQEVKVYRQRIKEMEEEVKKTEKALKVQIAEQERKAHENWVAANTAERSLSQEKTLTRTLREKLAALSTQLNDLRSSSSGRPAVRRGDSYGPSPVSGGAPSPPLMIEGPGRSLSAPIGRRIDPLGPRPPSEKHAVPSRSDSAAPRTSSPANMEDSQTTPAQSEALESVVQASSESPEPSSRPQGPGSFMESPIRDSSGPLSHGPPPLGPRGVPPPPFGHGYRPPPPPSYLPPGVRQANGNEGPPGGDFRYRPRSPNGHPGMMVPRPRLPMGPPGLRFPPSLPPHHGPVYRGGPPGPYGPYHQDIRFNGPRDYPMPPQHLPPGALPPPLQGGFPPQGISHLPAQGPRDPSGGPPPGQGQDSVSQHASAVQDSGRFAGAEP